MPGLGWIIGRGFFLEEGSFPCAGIRLDNWYRFLSLEGGCFPCARITGLGFPLWEGGSFPLPRLGWISGLGFSVLLLLERGGSFLCARSRLDEWYQYRVPFGKEKSSLC